MNGGGSDSWRYFTKHNNEEEQVETDEKTIMYDTISCLQDDDGDIMVAVEALRGAGYYDDDNNSNNNNVTFTHLSSNVNNMVGFENDFDSNEDLAAVNLHVNFEENKDYWNGMLN